MNCLPAVAVAEGTYCSTLLPTWHVAVSVGALKNELLHTPIKQFSYVELILGRASHLVNPAKLTKLLPGLAEHAQHLSIKTQLVDAARKTIGTVEHLMRRRCDTDSPG